MSIIETFNLCKSFGEKKIFDNFNMQVAAGEMLCLWGESGCGKTTLLNILGLLDSFDKGTLKIDGIINPKYNSKEALLLRRNVLGYIFQNFALIDNETVDQNLNLALTYNYDIKNKEEAKKEILQKLGLNNKQNQKIYELSGGEQQRVAIARVYLKPCKIILADEPTGSLDQHNKNIVIEQLRELNNFGKTVIVVTHDLEFAENCDRVINLKQI